MQGNCAEGGKIENSDTPAICSAGNEALVKHYSINRDVLLCPTKRRLHRLYLPTSLRGGFFCKMRDYALVGHEWVNTKVGKVATLGSSSAIASRVEHTTKAYGWAFSSRTSKSILSDETTNPSAFSHSSSIPSYMYTLASLQQAGLGDTRIIVYICLQVGKPEVQEISSSIEQNELTLTSTARDKEAEICKRPPKPTKGDIAGLQELNSFTKTVNQTMQSYQAEQSQPVVKVEQLLSSLRKRFDDVHAEVKKRTEEVARYKEGIRQADSAEHQVTNDRARIHQVKQTLDYDTDPQYASQLSVCSSNKDVQ
ncbi:hypothetical protein, conserved [Eimeria maxima]|uniref:Uncharacterized protein n=1 Tax=Eimeria maxima TaxID=5804 RepID=U6M341_EIMMA|nr:hypothetical protein, conserved [Eimeria maxima]CDJ58632.1 hypothetical protein, conserved [Eimeria maxima]